MEVLAFRLMILSVFVSVPFFYGVYCTVVLIPNSIKAHSLGKSAMWNFFPSSNSIFDSGGSAA